MSTTTVKEYEGTNETINRLLAEHWPDDKVFIVSGVNGRKPVTAKTEEEAKAIYEEEPSKWNAKNSED